MNGLTILVGDCRDTLRTLEPESVDCVVTSPPYFGLRDYGVDGQIGREPSLDEYVGALVAVFGALWPALKPTGTVWLNLGDCYAGSGKVQRTRHRSAESIAKAGVTRQGSHIGAGDVPCPEGLKPKDLMMVPARVALALQEAGWWLRSEIVWAKPRPMPESVRDRPTSAHEKIFLLAKQGSGYYYQDAGVPAACSAEEQLRKMPRDPRRSPDRNPGDGFGDYEEALKLFMLTKQGAGYHYEDPGVPVTASTVARGEAAVRALERMNGEDREHKYAGTPDAQPINAGAVDKAMARFAPRKYTDKTLNSSYAASELAHAKAAGLAPTFSDKWKGGGDSPGKYARAKELEAEWRVGDRPTRRLRNAERDAPVEAWWINPAMYPGAHFATFPPELVERCLQAGCPEGGHVLDPFGGAGTTALVTLRTGRTATLCELSEEYADLARRRVESGGRLDSVMRSERREERKRAEAEEHGQGSLL